MARPIVVSVAGVGSTPVVPVDSYLNPFSLSVGCELRGKAKYCVEHTYDDIYSPGFNADKATWHAYPGRALRAAKTSGYGGYLTPVRAVRGRIIEGDGALLMTVIHGGYNFAEGVTDRGQPKIYGESPVPTLWTRIKAFFNRHFV